MNDVNEIIFYLSECETKKSTQRQLHKSIKQNLYNRLSLTVKDKIILNKNLIVSDLVSNPILIKNDLLNNKIGEYTLKQLILNNLYDFLM